MKNRKDPLGLSATRIEMIKAGDEIEDREERRLRREGQAHAQNVFMSTIQHARERMDEISAHLDEHLGFAPDEITPAAVGIAKALLKKLDDAMTIAEQVDDLNQALHQADKDNPARG